MDLDSIVTQLRNYGLIFGGKVSGAAQFEHAVQDQTWMPAPAAYVVPLDQESTENQSKTGLKQVITERVGIIVCLDSTTDRRGQFAASQVNFIRAAIFRALLDWHIDPDRSPQGLYFGGARRLDFDRARLFWQYDFCLDEQITDADGFQTSGFVATGFDKEYVSATGVPIARQVVPIPQI